MGRARAESGTTSGPQRIPCGGTLAQWAFGTKHGSVPNPTQFRPRRGPVDGPSSLAKPCLAGPSKHLTQHALQVADGGVRLQQLGFQPFLLNTAALWSRNKEDASVVKGSHRTSESPPSFLGSLTSVPGPSQEGERSRARAGEVSDRRRLNQTTTGHAHEGGLRLHRSAPCWLQQTQHMVHVRHAVHDGPGSAIAATDTVD